MRCIRLSTKRQEQFSYSSSLIRRYEEYHTAVVGICRSVPITYVEVVISYFLATAIIPFGIGELPTIYGDALYCPVNILSQAVV